MSDPQAVYKQHLGVSVEAAIGAVYDLGFSDGVASVQVVSNPVVIPPDVTVAPIDPPQTVAASIVADSPNPGVIANG